MYLLHLETMPTRKIMNYVTTTQAMAAQPSNILEQTPSKEIITQLPPLSSLNISLTAPICFESI
jgi:hypothetical protein